MPKDHIKLVITLTKKKGDRMETKQFEVALYKSIKYGFEVLLKSTLASDGEYIRMSKPVMVEFEMLSDKEESEREIDLLRKEQDAVRIQMQASINSLEDRINKLQEQQK